MKWVCEKKKYRKFERLYKGNVGPWGWMCSGRGDYFSGFVPQSFRLSGASRGATARKTLWQSVVAAGRVPVGSPFFF